MNYDDWKLATPDETEIIETCVVCDEKYDSNYSQANNYDDFCCKECEDSQDDPGDSQDYVDNQ